MKVLPPLTITLFLVLILCACQPGTAPSVATSIPSALQTSAAQAPTVLPNAANTAAAALQAAATAAAKTGNTVVPSAATAASGAVQTAAPVVQTGAAAAQTAVGTAIPAAETAAAAARTAVATPPVIVLPGGATPTAGANTVEVKLSEYKIDMPTTLPAGAVTFRVTNAGTVEHSLTVEGQGIKKTFDKNLQPSETNTLQVNLSPGAYQVYCPVDDHRNLGMLVNLTVTP